MCVVDNGFTCAGVFAHTRQVPRGSCVVSACTFDSALHWLVADNAGAQGGPAQYFRASPRWSCSSPLRCISRATPGPGRTLSGSGVTAICPEQLPVRALRRTGLVARHKHGHARHSVVCACVAQLVAEARVIATNSPAIDLSACCGVQNLPTRHGCLAHQQVGKPKRTASRIMALPASRSCNRLRLPAMRKCGQNASFQTLTAPCPKRTGPVSIADTRTGTHCCVPGDLCGFFLGLGLLGTTALAADTRHMVTITTHGLATLSACFARFVASKFVRIATGMRRLATTARQQTALLRIQCGKTAPAASCVLSVLHCASSRCVDDYVTGYRRYRNYRANPQTHAFRCGEDQCRQKRLRSLCKSCTPASTRPDPKGIALPRTRRSAPLRAG